MGWRICRTRAGPPELMTLISLTTLITLITLPLVLGAAMVSGTPPAIAAPTASPTLSPTAGQINEPVVPPRYVPVIGGAVGGLLGLIGIFVAAGLKTRQEKRARDEVTHDTNLRVLSVIFEEIAAHQASLQYFIDGILPRWLHRADDPLDKAAPSHLSDDLYRAFRTQLLYSPLFIFVASYYKVVATVNHFYEAPPSPDEQSHGIRRCFAALEQSLYVCDEILKQPGVERCRTPVTQLTVDNYRHARQRYYLYYLLGQVTWGELSRLVHYLEMSDLQEAMRGSGRVDISELVEVRLEPHGRAILEIRDLIKGDTGSLAFLKGLLHPR